MTTKRITVAYGDGIGPEIMEATLKILKAANTPLQYDVIEVGQKMFEKGFENGIDPNSWELIRQNKVFLKAPITTPQGGGFKSLNVSARKNLSLFANVRPIRAYAPYVKTHHPDMNMVIVRENEEDLYAGIEYELTDEVVESLKLISRSGSEKIIRYAFEYARINGRKKVTCMTKDNIMKIADGLFHRVFNEVAAAYPDIETEHKIIDIGAALIADRPHTFDVVVTLNLYGDIISDIAAQVAGSVGLMGSSNIGREYAMFEAIHGSAPDIAGKGIANPSGLLNGALLMLNHIGLQKYAATIQNAWLKTLEDGIHTGDVYKEGMSTQKVGTQAFAEAVIARLGQQPANFEKTDPDKLIEKNISIELSTPEPRKRTVVGLDVYLDQEMDSVDLSQKIEQLALGNLYLKVLSNRGHNFYLNKEVKAHTGRHWRCRFCVPEGARVSNREIVQLLSELEHAGINFIKFETLCLFNGKRGYSLAPGE
ncbi:NADP-dependent isocitrate dehydrogenase [bacterium]|nr:NADP-dependent isocitrate dehydrogenase [bacterium]